MKLNPKQAKKIFDNPTKTAEVADLIYTSEDKLSIVRKKYGRGFIYLENDEKIKDKERIARFKSLVIPPAWTKVRISAIENSHLQVIGKDDKNRTQYLYHPLWNKIRNSTKFFRMTAFGEVLPKIRKQVDKDLSQKTMTKEKCLALVIRLMEETHIRIGSEQYAKRNKTYGLSTMRDRHIHFEDGNFTFDFTGKKGEKHHISLEDKQLQRLVMQCKEIPGWELFQYYDELGNHHDIDSGMVNEYIQEITGGDFSSKDFRTWAASKIFLETAISMDPAETKDHLKKQIIKACDTAAEELGNTRSVCRKYYVHPGIIDSFENGKLYELAEKYEGKTSPSDELEVSEKVMMEIISKYSFEI